MATRATLKRLGLNKQQAAYAKQICNETYAYWTADNSRYRTKKRAAECCIATGLVESNLKVYANGNNPKSMKIKHDAVGYDHGSVGIYQQQVGGAPNSTANWGTEAECMDVRKSTRKFLDALYRLTWNRGEVNGELCQRVQGSAFPDRYKARMKQAAAIVNAYLSDQL